MKHAPAPLFAALFVLAGCSSVPDNSKDPNLIVSQLSLVDFSLGVDAVFERRCGSLDCHGSTARGMRLYSQNGLRIPTQDPNPATPGNGPTSRDEINANFASIVGLQPELMNTFLAKNPKNPDDAYQLIILTKPLGLERHKGGNALSKGEPAEQCIVTWLLGKADQGLCAKGSSLP
jgi:hypothetical protein